MTVSGVRKLVGDIGVELGFDFVEFFKTLRFGSFELLVEEVAVKEEEEGCDDGSVDRVGPPGMPPGGENGEGVFK